MKLFSIKILKNPRFQHLKCFLILIDENEFLFF